MKKLISLLAAMLLMLTGALAEAPTEAEFPLAFAFDVSWEDTQETLLARLGDDAFVVSADSLLVTLKYDGMAYAVIYGFSDGKLASVLATTDSVGGVEGRTHCAAHYDKLVAGVEAVLGEGTPVQVNDTWKSAGHEAMYGAGDLSVPMYEGWLSRKSVYYGENAMVTTAFTISGNSLMCGVIIEPPRPYTGIWTEKAYSDNADTYIASNALQGTTEVTGQGSAAVQGSMQWHTYTNTNGLYLGVSLTGNHYTSNYGRTGADVPYDLILVDGEGVTHTWRGVMEDRTNYVCIEDEDAAAVAAAMGKGGMVTMMLRSVGYPSTTHTFELNADGLAGLFEPWYAAHPSYGGWLLKSYSDSPSQYIVSSAFYGAFSNNATTGSDLEAYIFCQTFSDTGEEFVKLRMYEYGTYQVENIFSNMAYYTITVMDRDGVKHSVSGYIAGRSKDIMVTGSDASTIINALRKGGRVQFFIQHNDYSHTMYSFTISDAAGFAAVYADWK